MDYFDFVLKMLSIVIFTFFVVVEIKIFIEIIKNMIFLLIVYSGIYNKSSEESKMKLVLVFQKKYNGELIQVWGSFISSIILLLIASVPLYFAFNYLFY